MSLPKTPALTSAEIEELREYSDNFTCGALILEWIAENKEPHELPWGSSFLQDWAQSYLGWDG
jgi:hypothetical protein